MELVKLAYPQFNDETRKVFAKDYFIKGIHPKMQISLKSLPNFVDADINKLASETTRLQCSGQSSRRPRGRGFRNTSQQARKCRSCQSTEHLFRDCPTRFCQACGKRGHDAWQQSCPNYQ